jgi:glutamate dehydrogenase (NAD(P)+)
MDLSGALLASEGLDPHALISHLQSGGSLAQWEGEGVEMVDEKSWWQFPADVLIPAALGGEINEERAQEVQVKWIVEGANHPTTPEADKILASRNIRVIPDLLANAGGVIVSYFEWVQNIQRFRWEREDVENRLEKIMKSAVETVYAQALANKDQDWRAAAYDIAISRVVQAGTDRGYMLSGT